MTLPTDPVAHDDGWLPGITRVPSPNHGPRPPDASVRLIVVHAISLPPGVFGGNAIEDFFSNRLDPGAHPYFHDIATQRVSAHFLIRRSGAISQFVSCHDRAWHAGVSCWRGRERCNDISIGIELEGDDHHAFEPPQYDALSVVIAQLRIRFPIEAIVGHADIAAGRKTDPGPHFEWQRISIA